MPAINTRISSITAYFSPLYFNGRDILGSRQQAVKATRLGSHHRRLNRPSRTQDAPHPRPIWSALGDTGQCACNGRQKAREKPPPAHNATSSFPPCCSSPSLRIWLAMRDLIARPLPATAPERPPSPPRPTPTQSDATAHARPAKPSHCPSSPHPETEQSLNDPPRSDSRIDSKDGRFSRTTIDNHEQINAQRASASPSQ